MRKLEHLFQLCHLRNSNESLSTTQSIENRLETFHLWWWWSPINCSCCSSVIWEKGDSVKLSDLPFIKDSSSSGKNLSGSCALPLSLLLSGWELFLLMSFLINPCLPSTFPCYHLLAQLPEVSQFFTHKVWGGGVTRRAGSPSYIILPSLFPRTNP